MNVEVSPQLDSQGELAPVAARIDAADLAVVLVIGPYAGALFPRGSGNTALRREGRAVWLRIDSPAQLPETLALIRGSHGKSPEAVLIPVLPDGDIDGAVLRQEFSRWRNALEVEARHPACVLPCYLALYACLGPEQAALPALDLPCWFGDTIDLTQQPRGLEHVRQGVQAVRRQLDHAARQTFSSRQAARSTLGHAVLDWTEDVALLSSLSALANTSPFALHGLMLADLDKAPLRAGAWTRWLVGRTGLRPRVTTPWTGALPLPTLRMATDARESDKAAALAVLERWQTHGPLTTRGHDAEGGRGWWATRWSHVAIWSTAAVLATSIGWAGWLNGRLIERVAAHVDTYRDTSNEAIDEKRAAFDMLHLDRDELAQYARHGVPFELGWGLYRGGALRPVLDHAIATYRPIPTTAQFDALALFDTGRSTLTPGRAERELRTFLRLILANPAKQVLIAGHADSEGSPAANLALSEARARAIRDWFMASGHVPAERFVVKAYGDTRPAADNRYAAGRALNRRVEVALISAHTMD